MRQAKRRRGLWRGGMTVVVRRRMDRWVGGIVAPCCHQPEEGRGERYNAIWLDEDKCIKCGRCVTVCHEVQGIGRSVREGGREAAGRQIAS